MAIQFSRWRSPRKIVVILVVAALSLVALAWNGFGIRFRSAPPADPGTPEQQAVVAKAAFAILDVVDAGDYERAWIEGSPLLQQSVSKSRWLMGLTALRARLGTLKERRGVGVGFTHNLGEGPDGEYCAVGFESSFATTAVREKVTMHFHEERWKMVGYKVKKTLARLKK